MLSTVSKVLLKCPPATQECWRCDHSPGDPLELSHNCWLLGEIVSTVNNVAKTSLVPSMSICLLELVKELVSTVAEPTMIGLLFFYARKAITLSWKKASPPVSYLLETSGQC